MSWEVIPFRPEHVAMMRLQRRQLRLLSYELEPHIETLNLAGPAVTAIADGDVIGCAGIVEQGFGIGTLWGFIGEDSGPYFLRLHRIGQRLMRLNPLRRIESSTEVDFAQGCRWLELLGFQSEGILRQYGPDGSDHRRYSWLSSP